MSKREPLTTDEILQLWLTTQIGSKGRILPKGYDKPSSSGAAADTKARAANLVESMPMYDLIRWRLIDWTTLGFPDSEEYLLCGGFEAHLHNHLLAYPFYPTTSRDMEESAKTPVQHRTVDDVASELQIKPNTLRKRLDRRKTAFLYGSFTDDVQKWQINPLDVPEIKAMFGAEEEEFA